MSAILFFDDWYLERRENLVRHIGQPDLVPAGTLEDPYLDIAWGYPRVYQNPDTGMWHCFYQGQSADGRFVPVAAESRDGIHWQIPDLAETVHLRDRLTPHQLFGLRRYREWCGVYADPNAIGTDQWLKGLVNNHGPDGEPESLLVTSPDGIRWRYIEDVRWHPHGIDPASHAFWNPYRQSYVLTVRPFWGDRRIAISETRDWRDFSAPEWALQTDALDTACAQIYGMPAFQYENMFIAFLWIYHTDPNVNRDTKAYLGKIDCQLTYSHNGWHFQRTLREPFIPNASPGEYGAGCVYPASLVHAGDTLRIYSSTSKGEHGQIVSDPESRQSAILLHTLRLDGFVYLEPIGGAGEMVTRLLLWGDGEPTLNVSAPQGIVRIQAMDENGTALRGYSYDNGVPFTGDSVTWTPEWRDGRKLASLRNRIIRLAIKVTNGRLYAIRGEFEVKIVTESRRYLEKGVRTLPRPGF